MLPIKALRREAKTPYVTYALVFINVLVFAWELRQGSVLGQKFGSWAVVPCEIGNSFFSIDTLMDFIRTMFLHASWPHIIGNMVFLLIFGPHVEGFFGGRWFLVFYFASGFMATLTHTVLLNRASCAPVVGSSGAIAGVLGSYLLLYPTTRIRTVVLFFRVPFGTIDIHALFMLIGIFLLDLADAIGSLGWSSASGVAVWAHVGGFVTGLVFTFFFTAFVKPLPEWDPLG